MKQTLLFFSLLLLAVTGFAQINLTNGLIAYYPLDLNANDVTMNPANGTVSGATLTSNKINEASKAYAFSSSLTDKISTPASNKFNFSTLDSFSFSLWVKPFGTGYDDSRILSFAANGGFDVNFNGSVRGTDVGKLQVMNFDGVNVVIQFVKYSDSTLKLNTWQHIVITVAKNGSSNDIRMFINGRQAAQMSSAKAAVNSAYSLTIGNHINQNWGFNGAIDEVRVYNKMLTQSEINALDTITPANIYDTIQVQHNVYDTIQVQHDVYDTVIVTINVYDTIHVSTTDTLIIEVNTTGIGQPGGVMNLVKVYPNPASNHIYIDNGNYSQMSSYSVTIINSLGQTVFGSLINQQTFDIDISSWNAGVYFMNLTDQNNNSITKKIQINK